MRDQQVFLATVTAVVSDGVKLRFDGEVAARAKTYKVIGSSPAVGDRVTVAAMSGTYVVVGAGGTAVAVQRRNPITNGCFSIWQAGDSFNGDGYAADMWVATMSGATAVTSRQAFTPGQTDVPYNPLNYLRFDVSVGNDHARIANRIENVLSLAGEKVTLEFYARGTNPGGGAVGVAFIQNFGTSGSAEAGTAAQNIILTANWKKYTLEFTMPSIAGKTVGANNYLELRFFQPGGDTSTAAWRLDLANVGAPFIPRSYGEELALCQRYYWQGTFPDGWCANYGTAGSGLIRACGVSFPVTMRITPAMAVVTPPTYSNCSYYDLVGDPGGMSLRVSVTAAGLFRATAGVYSASARL